MSDACATAAGADGTGSGGGGVAERVLVLDFGSQYSHIIVRKIREAGVYAELRRCDIPWAEIEAFGHLIGIVLSGGPSSVYEQGAPHVCEEFWERVKTRRIPLLGICYGLQEIVNARPGGEVQSGRKGEYGAADFTFSRDDPLFSGLLDGLLEERSEAVGSAPTSPSSSGSGGRNPEALRVWMSHGDKVARLPVGFEAIGQTANCEFAAVRCTEERVWGLQFHPEVAHTERGTKILRNFVCGICGATGGWTMKNFRTVALERLRAAVGEKGYVIGALSGGVDSTVAAALTHEAVGERFHGFLIDNGLLRHEEAQQVETMLKK
eukprot:GHVU01197343.1.p1 GENE.GHVU01197343.1~~GHVU01197343.1.p1  ORF type:complete len:322 (+),score=40.86 GHVU01197343.1:265-1230(+)